MRHSFDSRADSYDTHAHVQARAAVALADWIAPEERKGLAAELGAGTGLLTKQLQPWDGEYLVADISKNMLARAQVSLAAHKNLRYQKMDAAQPELPAQTQWILSSSMAQWLDNPQEALSRWRAQAPKANLALSVFVEGTLCELLDVLPECAPLTWRSVAQWEHFLRAAGWQIERAQEESFVCHHPDALALLRSLKGFGATAKGARVGAGALREGMRKYGQKYACPRGVRATWRVFRVIGRA